MEKKHYSQTVVTLCVIAFFMLVGYTACKGQTGTISTVPGIGTAFSITETKPTPTKYDWRHSLKRAIYPASLSIVSGMAGGLHEGLVYRRTEFFRAFPKASRNFWDTNISRYHQAEILGQPQDAYHLADDLRLGGVFLSGSASTVFVLIPIIRGEKRPWWHMATDIVIQSAVFSIGYFAGQELVFNGILHKQK